MLDHLDGVGYEELYLPASGAVHRAAPAPTPALSGSVGPEETERESGFRPAAGRTHSPIGCHEPDSSHPAQRRNNFENPLKTVCVRRLAGWMCEKCTDSASD